MTIVTLVSGCGNAYPGDGTRDGGGEGGRWVSSRIRALDDAVRVKLADRIANVEAGGPMVEVYRREQEPFRGALYS
jgi:hypothetical protein